MSEETSARWYTLSTDVNGPDEDGFVDLHFAFEAAGEGFFFVTVSGHGKSHAKLFVQAALVAAQQVCTAAGGGKLPGVSEIIPVDDTDMMSYPPSSGKLQ